MPEEESSFFDEEENESIGNESGDLDKEELEGNYEIRGGEIRHFYGVEIKEKFQDSEIKLLTRLVESPDISEFELMQESSEYPFFYHLSERRGFVTEVMGLDKSISVLEIGSECGGVTGALLHLAGEVDCICSHERSANISALRNRSQHYSIYVGPIEGLQIEKKYDVVTMIGALSYASRYSNSPQPYAALLRFATEHLKQGGHLYIATENTIGMKFLAGASYDYRPQSFVNLQYPSYATERSPYRTFTKSQLKSMLAREGLDLTYFYYPYPDFKFPSVIYSDDMYMEPSFVNVGKEYQFSRYSFFNESMAYIVLNGTEEIKTLANSFLVEAWKSI